MKKYKYILFVMTTLMLSCSYGDLNDNPNEPIEVPEILLLKGTMLSNIQINAGHLQRVSGMWSSQYTGEEASYLSLQNYNYSPAETNPSWSFLYNGILEQNDLIQAAMPDNRLVNGITKVVEAHATGTGASTWGDMPYVEATDQSIEDPVFDGQLQVFAAMQDLLDEAIVNLSGIDGYNLPEDIFFGGDAAKWLAVAYTLKARYYVLTRNYDLAYQMAQNGVASSEGSMYYYPSSGVTGVANLLFQFTNGTRSGFLSSEGTYLTELIADGATSRNNAKTNEQARSNYYYIDPDGDREVGVAGSMTPMPLVTYKENMLILAEAAARTSTMSLALGHLNELRAFLASGDSFVKVDEADVAQYDAYVEADFISGGIENLDGIAENRALLREIIEERYVSCYGLSTVG